MLGNGSDELISLLAMACDVPGATILAPLPGFVMYEMSAQAAGPALRRRAADGRLRARRGGDAGRDRAAPAGAHLHRLPEQPDRQPVRRRARSSASSPRSARRTGWSCSTRPTSRSASRSWMPRLGAHPHVLVMRTLSKFGLAGVRLGYLVGAGGADRRDRQGAPALQRQRAERRGDAVRARACRRVRAPGRVIRAERERLQAALRGAAGRASPSRARPT